MRKLAPFLFALCLIVLLGCGQIANLSTSVSRIEITPSTATMLAYTTQEFTATAYNASGAEVYFTPSSWAMNPYTYGDGVRHDSGGKSYFDFVPLAEGTIELRVFYGGIWGVATIEALVGTLETLYVTPKPATVGKNGELTFYASGEDISGHFLTAVPATWEVLGVSGTIETGPSSAVIFSAGSTPGTGIVYAYFGGVMGSSEITITGSTSEATFEADASVYVDQANSGNNYSGLDYFYVGYTTGSGTFEGLLHFDLSGIPSTANISSVKVKIYVISRTGTLDAALKQAITSWTEGTVTYGTKPTSAGTTLGSGAVPDSSNYMTITLNTNGKNIVQGWVDGSIPSNYGFYLVKAYAFQAGTAAISSRTDDEFKRPVIIINYSE